MTYDAIRAAGKDRAAAERQAAERAKEASLRAMAEDRQLTATDEVKADMDGLRAAAEVRLAVRRDVARKLAGTTDIMAANDAVRDAVAPLDEDGTRDAVKRFTETDEFAALVKSETETV